MRICEADDNTQSSSASQPRFVGNQDHVTVLSRLFISRHKTREGKRCLSCLEANIPRGHTLMLQSLFLSVLYSREMNSINLEYYY